MSPITRVRQFVSGIDTAQTDSFRVPFVTSLVQRIKEFRASASRKALATFCAKRSIFP